MLNVSFIDDVTLSTSAFPARYDNPLSGVLQFRQRIVSHYHLKAFAPTETREFVVFRLHRAGGSEALFTPDAVESLHALTGGIPRRINKLCDTAFVYAYAQGLDTVTKDVVEKVIADRGDHGMLDIE